MTTKPTTTSNPILHPTSNIKNKIRNTNLPKTKSLYPLFEVVSNSIHAISDAKKRGQLKGKGKIEIKIIRQGREEVLIGLGDIDNYPIKSFEIVDNGIGLNDENLHCFTETDTDHKLDIGGKGVGRFICLKAFRELIIESCFLQGKEKFIREFVFRPTREGFHDFIERKSEVNKKLGTKITLSEFKVEYQKNVPLFLFDIARNIITHFQLYFITESIPIIAISNQNGLLIDLRHLFETEFAHEIKQQSFHVDEFEFRLFLSKSYKAQSHRIHFCAHNRTVRDEGLYNKIVDLGKNSIIEGDTNFYYQAFVVGKLLDDNVDVERAGFDFPQEEYNEFGEEISEEITLAKIRREAISAIETLLADYIRTAREKKIEEYRPIVNSEFPQYKNLFKNKINEVEKLPRNLTIGKLDVELYKIESTWRLEVKEELKELVNDIPENGKLEEYKSKYEKFLTEFNEIGQSELARYIVHRKAVIDLLEELIAKKIDEKFYDEDIIHSLFFPMRTTSDEVPYDTQNLWLLDDKLSYHTYLASDKSLKDVDLLDLGSIQRPDLIIFNNAIAFAEEKYNPFSSITIIEFKKPQRDNFKDYDSKKNPLDQVEMYIDELLKGTVDDKGGRKLKISKETPFYVYIVCDITDSFEQILMKREFNKTPDGQGYYLFKNKYYNAYIEVIPFHKVITDVKKRNRILFEKLGIT